MITRNVMAVYKKIFPWLLKMHAKIKGNLHNSCRVIANESLEPVQVLEPVNPSVKKFPHMQTSISQEMLNYEQH